MSQNYFEVVVVGAGASGIGAALTAAQQNLSVLLLEKGNRPGGAGMFGAQGLFAVESQQQQQSGESYTVKDAFQELVDYSHHRVNESLVKKIVAESAATITWLNENGLATELVSNTQEAHQKHPRVYHQYIDKFNGFARLLARFEALGGVLLTETTGKEIVTDDAGRVTGIQILEKQGRSRLINCRAVIAADGGFVGNQKMVASTLETDSREFYSMGERKATGDGLRMLAQIGADTRKKGAFENHAASVVSQVDPKWRKPSIFTLTNLPLLWVDRAGKRFTNEGVVYDFALWGNTTFAAGGCYYYLFDEAFVAKITKTALPLTDSFERTFKNLAHKEVTHQIGPFAQLKEDLQEAQANQVAFVGETLSVLADKLGMSATELVKTVTEYNRFVKNKADLQFYKDPAYLQFDLQKGPFYAVKATTTSLGTIGGVRVNEKMEVLGMDGLALKGAYATGNNASGMYDTSYPTLEGVSCAFAWNSGRIAGQAVGNYLQNSGH
ncbi:FAD-dependent oxidoreductase [Liquorilactobacillus satsumensis]|nr:FAD-dependent oxidoreductase [Liquorilactobacillus satsumensis]MCP9329045.1 FAD-dependent oxidoreductase [Liquorilactobacillus satsumensis]